MERASAHRHPSRCVATVLGARGSCLDGVRSSTDYVEHKARVREHRDVAAGDLGCGGAHPLSNEPFHVWVDGAVILGNDVPAWLRSPGSSSDFRVEQVRSRHALRRPNELLFLLGQIACETVDAFRKEPDTSVRDFDVGEDVRFGEVRLLCLRCLVGVRSKRGDIDQPGNAVVRSGAGDDAPAVRVPDKDGRAADPRQLASLDWFMRSAPLSRTVPFRAVPHQTGTTARPDQFRSAHVAGRSSIASTRSG